MTTEYINRHRTNMYELSVMQWNPFAGCKHNCMYCVPSFQLQIKRTAKKHCRPCYDFEPHQHPERLTRSLPRTHYMQFIFTCSSGDIAFCPTEYLEKIITVIGDKSDRTFLIQSKNPSTFSRIRWPRNVILGTTIETNRDDLCRDIATAPPPSRRYVDFLQIGHPLKMVTVEPVMKFDLEVMLDWMRNINPAMIWLGYDSKKCYLPEPELGQVQSLHWELSKAGLWSF